MKPINLGVNSNCIHYEVALEILGKELQPFIRAIREEQEKTRPSPALIKYCEMRMAAIYEMQDLLRVEDRDTIERILDPEDGLFRFQPGKVKT